MVQQYQDLENAKFDESATFPKSTVRVRVVEKLRYVDFATTTDYEYYGYTNSDGTEWQIKRLNKVNDSMRQASGVSDYPTAWSNRVSLDYNY